jgi:hypothetical protein
MTDTPFQIETDVPVPATGRRLSYPWDQLGDGNSILIETEDPRSAVQSARTWVKRQRPGWRVVSRKVEIGTRIWFLNENPEENNDDS